MRHKKTLVIMGTHPSSLKSFDWNRQDCDIWMFNEAAHLKNKDGELVYPKSNAVLQLHHEAIWKSPKNRSDEGHYKWLTSEKKQVVYMQEAYKEVPNSKRYPIEKVLSLVDNVKMIVDGKEKAFKYFSSSPDFALALVAQMYKEGKSYKRVEVWGIELVMESEYQYQRTGFGFWVGYLTALGVEIILYNSIFDAPMYGYEGDVAIPSTEFEARINDLTKELGEDKDKYNLEATEFLKSFSKLLDKDITNEIKQKLIQIVKNGERAGILNGKIKESTRYLEKAQAMEAVSGASVFSLGEFDGSRIMFNKQLQEVRGNIANLDLTAEGMLKRLLSLKKNSNEREMAISEFGNIVAELMNKNMLFFHISGAINENQYYVDSVKLSTRLFEN